jgi:hypothetical protein
MSLIKQKSVIDSKTKKKPVFKRNKGPADTTMVVTEAFIPGGITLSISPSGKYY